MPKGRLSKTIRRCVKTKDFTHDLDFWCLDKNIENPYAELKNELHKTFLTGAFRDSSVIRPVRVKVPGIEDDTDDREAARLRLRRRIKQKKVDRTTRY